MLPAPRNFARAVSRLSGFVYAAQETALPPRRQNLTPGRKDRALGGAAAFYLRFLRGIRFLL